MTPTYATREYSHFPIGRTGWYLTYNPQGGGLLLCVPRGIPCEGHTQVFSAHCTNNPEIPDVAAALESYNWGEEIDRFCLFMQAVGCWETKEAIGAVFCAALIRRIANKAESLWETRMRQVD